jgi:hypothetical protein
MVQTIFLLIVLVLTLATAQAQALGEKSIKGVFVDVSCIRHDAKSNGGTWDYICPDDDNVYTFSCDGVGYGTQSNNINFNKLTGASWGLLSGSPVNQMLEYGKKDACLDDSATVLSERIWPKVPKGPDWKVTGADFI